METIAKYTLNFKDAEQKIATVKGARFISAELQNGNIVVYARVNKTIVEKVTRLAKVVTTGKACETDGTFKFLGTVMSVDGKHVRHVFVTSKEVTMVPANLQLTGEVRLPKNGNWYYNPNSGKPSYAAKDFRKDVRAIMAVPPTGYKFTNIYRAPKTGEKAYTNGGTSVNGKYPILAIA